MAAVVMPTDQNENKKQGSDPTKQEDKKPAAEAQTRGEDPPKNTSWWTKAKKMMLRKLKGESSKPKCKSDESPAAPDATQPDPLRGSIVSSIDHIRKLAEDLESHTSKVINDHLDKFKKFYDTLKIDVKDPDDEKKKLLEDLRMDLIKLSLKVPSKNKAGADKKDPLENLKFITIEAEQRRFDAVSVKMPQLHQNPIFETSMELKEFVARYNKLEDRVKLCLLCFSIFPADAIIKKRLMVQWWVVEGYALSEEVADCYFKLLLEKGFVEPVNPNRSLSVGSCRVHPFNRWALVALAERANFFNFEQGGDPTQNFSGCFQACLMGRGLISYDDFVKKKNESGKEGHADAVIKGVIDDLEKLHLVMNVDEHVLEFKHEWVGKMRNVNVLYLGRWKASPTHHIEVEDVEFLVKGLESMRCVKLLSLQGVSNIISLPDSILKLTNVNVLDLRACYNLESIPKAIGQCLHSLTHLDMSECYLLNHMPKSLSELTHLKVLKGFFVGVENNDKSHCTLDDLENLDNLEKLCIYTNSNEFPEDQDVVNLEKLKKLRKLTITWGVHEAKPEAKAEAEVKAEAKGGAGAEAKAGAGAEAEAEAKAKAEAEGEAEAEAKAKAEAETGAKTKVETEAEAGTEAKAGAEAEAGPEAKANAKVGEVAKASKLPASLEKLDLKCFPMSGAGAGAEAEAGPKAKAKAKANAKAGEGAKASKLPASLEKLDLKCFPMCKTPDWLKLQNLGQLKKLYVRGGKFCDVGQYEDGDKVWKVEVLRLKYLTGIDMEWMRLQELFPELKYLEQVSCPKLTFFPCDAKGVWINPE